jgi:hypothetical protein
MFRPSQGVIFRPWNYKSNTNVIGIPADGRKPYDFSITFIIPRPEDDPLRGSKHVA